MTKAAQGLFQIVLFTCINKMQVVTDNECGEHYTCYLNPIVYIYDFNSVHYIYWKLPYNFKNHTILNLTQVGANQKKKLFYVWYHYSDWL